MQKPKVIHVITRFDKGGAAESTYLLARGLDPQSYEVLLIRGLARQAPAGISENRAIANNLEELSRAGVGILTIPELMRDIRPSADLKAFLKLIEIFRKERPQIVHTHTSKAGMLGRWAAHLAGVPIIIHTPHGHVFWGYFNRWETALYVFLERLTAAITDKIITLTERETSDHLGRRIAPADRFATIHSGVALEEFSSRRVDPSAMRKELGLPADAFVVGTVGRLTPIKGHKYLIAAAQKVLPANPGMIFVFLGDGELLDELQAQAAEAGIQKNVRFLGWRPDVAGVMATFDVFVLPSLNEGMGKVLVEAMALAKPIIASAVGGIPDLVSHGENGLLVPGADAQALAGSLKLLSRDPARRQTMGARGKLMAAAYSAESMIRKVDELYGALLKDLPDSKPKQSS